MISHEETHWAAGILGARTTQTKLAIESSIHIAHVSETWNYPVE